MVSDWTFPDLVTIDEKQETKRRYLYAGSARRKGNKNEQLKIQIDREEWSRRRERGDAFEARARKLRDCAKRAAGVKTQSTNLSSMKIRLNRNKKIARQKFDGHKAREREERKAEKGKGKKGAKKSAKVKR